eukprot:3024289-Lingulodinium_polyedra.AAC.1
MGACSKSTVAPGRKTPPTQPGTPTVTPPNTFAAGPKQSSCTGARGANTPHPAATNRRGG